MNLSQHFPLKVSEEGAGQRIDQYLHSRFQDISRSRWARLIEGSLFSIGGCAVDSSRRLKTGESIELNDSKRLEEEFDPLKKELPKFQGPVPEILLEDEDVLVLNKAPDLAVHPGSGLPVEKSLVGWLLENNKISSLEAHELLEWDSDILEQARPGIVHRLDRGTSGVLVTAKNPRAHEKLAQQFSDRSAGRLYWAVVFGRVESLLRRRPKRIEDLLLLNPCPIAFRAAENGLYSFAASLERDPANRTRFRLSRGEGKKSITHFCEISHSSTLSLLELKLETGRTHQIRIHLSALGFPILGDTIYGGRDFRRLLLHAHTLKFFHPTSGKAIEVQARWPKEDLDWLSQEGLALGSQLKNGQKNAIT